jgi:cytidylate kinase
MNVITVTREYGAGGYEVARRLAEVLGWELLDRELLHQAAEVEHVPDADLERLDEKAITLADRFRLHPPHQHYIHGLREAALRAATRGNVVLVGRGTGQLLAEMPSVLHLRLVAPREWRARRMAHREGWTLEAAMARCTAEDRTRDRFTHYFFGAAPFQAAAYHFIANTGWIPLEDVVACTAALVQEQPAPAMPSPRSSARVLTLSRELGAGERSFAPALAARLGLEVYDRELLEQEAVRLGVTSAELEQIDEHPAGLWQRMLPDSLHHRYVVVLEQLIKDLAARANVILVGRGGSRFLRGVLGAFHVRLVALMNSRVQRVMQHRWVREAQARQLIAHSDSQRGGFYHNAFGADWASPLEYHLTVNTGRLGPAAVDLVASAAERHWASVAEIASPAQPPAVEG